MVVDVGDVPRKGNVDRNYDGRQPELERGETFPARGTWIEMLCAINADFKQADVPRKGNVDRNMATWRRHWR